MLNVYVGLSVCGSSGRLLVLRSLYLWATTVICRHAKHSLMRKMFQSWVGFVLFFLVFTHFLKSPKENVQSPCWSLHACICSLLIWRYVFIFLFNRSEWVRVYAVEDFSNIIEVAGWRSSRSSRVLLSKWQFPMLGKCAFLHRLSWKGWYPLMFVK